MVQTAHAIADFAAEHIETFNKWKEESNSIISLSVPSEEHLKKLYRKLSKLTDTTYFSEPDIDDQWTSVCLYGTPDIRKKLSYLPLCLKSLNVQTS